MAGKGTPHPDRSLPEVRQAVIALLTEVHRAGQESLADVDWISGGGMQWNVAEVYQAYAYSMCLLVVMTAEVEAAQAAGRPFSVSEFIQRQALRAAGGE
jgi:hypothetical protein